MAVTYKRRCRAQGLRPQAGASRDKAPLAAILNASGSSDPDGSIVPYLWHFRFRDESESHLQHSGGTYTVTLTVTDDGTLREAFSIELKLAEGFSPIILESHGSLFLAHEKVLASTGTYLQKNPSHLYCLVKGVAWKVRTNRLLSKKPRQ